MRNHRSIITALTSIAVILTVMLPVCAVTHNEYVGTFTSLKIPNNISVIYKCSADSAGFARFELTKGKRSPFIFNYNKEKETLTIETVVELPDSVTPPTIFVYSRTLKELESSSNKSVYLKKLAPVSEFSVTLMDNGTITIPQISATKVKASIATGAGTISIGGTCARAEFSMLGNGHILASGLMADTVSCTILGGGEITCWPLDRLASKGIGSTHIWYKGMPEISKKGGGHIKSLYEKEQKRQ